MSPFGTGRLLRVFLAALVAWLAVNSFGIRRTPHPLQDVMQRAQDRAAAAYAVVDSVKRARELPLLADSQVRWRALLGEDYTPMTTTLGSLAAKEVATNPAWAGLMVRLLDEAGVGAGDTVGVLASGSFPSLTLATLAAIREMGAHPKLMVSLGASTFGANSRLATWLDIQAWVAQAGVLDGGCDLVTFGGEGDRGLEGLDEGNDWMRQAAIRSGRQIFQPVDLNEAMAARLALLESPGPAAVVNIGGGQAALGSCSHAAGLPPGLWTASQGCRCPDRGTLARLHEAGVPIVHLLSIRELAVKYGLDPEPGTSYRDLTPVGLVTRADPRWVLGGLLFVGLFFLRIPPRRKFS